MKKIFLVIVMAFSFLTYIHAEEKTLVDFFLPMEPQAPLVGAESGVWGSDNVFPRDTANGLEDPFLEKYVYWDGGIVKDDDGKYHIYSSAWGQEHDHHTGWTKESLAVHSVSDHVMGPYRTVGLTWPTWTPVYQDSIEATKNNTIPGCGHNVYGFRMLDGRYGIVSAEVTPGDVFASDDPYGPFEYLGRIKVDVNGFSEGLYRYWWNHHMSDVTILPRNDGRYMIIARNMVPLLSDGDDVTGPYKIMDFPIYSRRLDLPQDQNEDNAVWYSGGMYHILYHHWPSHINHHFTSKNGYSDWRYRSSYDRHETNIFTYTDGTQNDWKIVEAPTALMGEDGHVSHFFFSVINSLKGEDVGNDQNASKIVVVPFDGKAFDEYMAEVVKNDPPEEVRPIDISNSPDDPNALNTIVNSFETVGPNTLAGWMVQHPDNFTSSTEQVFHGEHSLCYTNNDASSTISHQVQGVYNSDLYSPEVLNGRYELSVHFWAEDISPNSILITFMQQDGYKNVALDISTIEKRKWVKVTQKVEIKDFDCKLRRLNIVVPGGQQGTVYMDKMELVRVGDIVENTGFGNPQMMSFEIENAANVPFDGWYSPQANVKYWSRTDAQASDGTYSMCFTADKGTMSADISVSTDDGDNSNVENTVYITEEGKYHIEFDLYMDPAKNSGLSSLQLACNANAWFPGWINNIQSLDKGKWITVSTPQMNVTSIIKEGWGKLTFKVPKDADDADDVLLYIDNVRLVNESKPTGVEYTTMTPSIRVRTHNGTLVVDGAVIGDVIGVYDMAGRLMTSAKVTTENSVVIPAAKGCYVVRVGDVAKKVIL